MSLHSARTQWISTYGVARQFFGTVCRLCKTRTGGPEYPSVVITSVDAPVLLSYCYCEECYSYLFDEAKSHLPTMPSVSDLVKAGSKGMTMDVYAVLIKKGGNPMQLFYPNTQAKMDAWLKERRERRKLRDKEKGKKI